LRRLLFGEHGHLVGGKFEWVRFSALDLPEDQTSGKDDGDRSRDVSSFRGIQNTILS
jgi:hypothetical protein